jgi:anti-anti-sigma factor
MNGWWSHVSGERFEVLWIGQVAVATMPIEMDISNADQVREDLLSVINRGAVLLIADLSRTTFCDLAGVSALVRAFGRASASDSEMRLAVTTLAVRRVLAITGVDRLLDIYPSVAASLAGRHDQAGSSAGTRETTAENHSPNGGGGCGGSPLTLVTIALAMSRSFTLLFCDADRRMANARSWVQCSVAMTMPSA